MIRARKSSITDAQVMLQEVEHKITSLGKEKTTNEHRMEHLEKSYEWIVHDKQYVLENGWTYLIFANLDY